MALISEVVKKQGGKHHARPGGTWRAFVRQQTLGRQGRPDLHELGHAYRDARAQGSLQYASRLGQVATDTAHLDSSTSKLSSFGKSGQLLQRLHQSNVQKALWQVWKGKDITSRATSLVSKEASISGLQSVIQKLRSIARQDTIAKKKVESDVFDILEKYNAGPGQEHLHQLTQTLPFLAKESWRVLPFKESVLLLDPERSKEVSSQAAAWAQAHSHHNLGVFLENAWADLHTTIQGAINLPPDPECDAQQSKCRAAGRCLHHSMEGRTLFRLRNSFLRVMKDSLGTVVAKKLLSEGLLVLHLKGQKWSSTDGSDASLQLWFHVALQYWSPYRPTFHVVEPVPDPEPYIHTSNDERVFVKAM
eukprot:5518161-Amphidinium_carterae.4